MADTTTPKAAWSSEKTFRAYTREQGDAYAQNRRGYHPDLFRIVLDHHTSTGGELNAILDVGCGPGTAVRGLAPHFRHAYGLDASEGMISTARSLGGLTSTSERIHFEVSSAEELGCHLSNPIADGSIDLITAASAAHWFDLDGFWPRAAKVLKPGGTVAFWSGSSMRVRPTVPNAVAIQEAVTKIIDENLEQYLEAGNRLGRDLYINLPLPWTIDRPVAEFDETTFVRKEWNKGGDCAENEEFFMGAQTLTLDMLEKALGTGSPITRWRQAHPDAVGTEQDIVRILRWEIERLLHEAGVEPGKELIKGGVAGVLLMVKKKV